MSLLGRCSSSDARHTPLDKPLRVLSTHALRLCAKMVPTASSSLSAMPSISCSPLDLVPAQAPMINDPPPWPIPHCSSPFVLLDPYFFPLSIFGRVGGSKIAVLCVSLGVNGGTQRGRRVPGSGLPPWSRVADPAPFTGPTTLLNLGARISLPVTVITLPALSCLQFRYRLTPKTCSFQPKLPLSTSSRFEPIRSLRASS